MPDRPDANSLGLTFLTERYTNEGVFTLRWHRGGITVYRDGSDRLLRERELRAIIAGYLVGKGVPVSSRLVGDIIEVVVGLGRIDDDRDPPFWLQKINGAELITCRNGNVSLSDRDSTTKRWRLLPHTPLYYSVAAPLPFDYVPNATCPLFTRFLQEITGGDLEYISFIEEFLGYLFVPGNPYQVFVLFVGSGANGKTTLIKILEWLVGPGNVSHIPLSRFADRFSLHEMIGRRLNSASETITTIDAEGEARLKELTGGDTVAAEIKFVQGRINFTPSAKIVIATNSIPHFKDQSCGIWRRLHLVPFRISIPEDRQDPMLVEKLKLEGPGILNLALDGRDRLIAQGGFTVPAERTILLEEIRRNLDPIREFLTTAYEESANGEYVGCADAYRAYTNWCSIVGVRIVDERYFGRRVKEVFYKSDRRQRGGRGSQTWVYLGIMPRTLRTLTNSYSRAQEEEVVSIGGRVKN